MNIKDAIRKWVPIINEKFGMREFDENCIRWFDDMEANGATFEVYDDYYIVGAVNTDIYGNDCLFIFSCGNIGVKGFLAMQARIEQIARDHGCKYIMQGSVLDKRYNDFLIKRGYTAAHFRKEVF